MVLWNVRLPCVEYMPDSFTVKVEGLAELEKALNELPEKMAKGAIRTASRKAGQLVRKAAQQNVRSSFVKRTGTLERGIIVATTIKPDGVKGAKVLAWIGLRIKPKQLSAFYGKFLEFGWIRGAKVRAAKARKTGQERGGSQVPARKFLTPAFESQKRNMLEVFIVELKKAIDKVTYKKVAV